MEGLEQRMDTSGYMNGFSNVCVEVAYQFLFLVLLLHLSLPVLLCYLIQSSHCAASEIIRTLPFGFKICHNPKFGLQHGRYLIYIIIIV